MWEMEGIDIHLNTIIGKHLSALGKNTTNTGTCVNKHEDHASTTMWLTGDTLTAFGDIEPFPSDRSMRRNAAATGVDVDDTELLDSDDLDDSADSGDVDSMATAEEAPGAVLLQGDDVPAFLLDANIDTRTRARLLEQEINEQATRVDDLKRVSSAV